MRYRRHLIERYTALLGYIGALVTTIGVLFFVPLVVLFFYPEEAIYAGDFIVGAVPLTLVGAFFWKRCTPRDAFYMSLPEGMVIVLLVWAIAVLVGALPLMLAVDLNFTQAIFESTSGWTTTGLSVVDVENAPRIVLFYRSLIQMAGGAGFVILAVAALAGPAGAGLSAAEGRTDQLAPHVRQSAGIVLRMYIGYIIIGILALRVVGMDWFDAVNHALTALATGGFSTQADSIGHFDSAAVEAVVIVLMILGGMNFLTAYTLLKGKFKAVVRNGEIRLEVAILVIAIPLLLIFTTTALYTDTDKQVRVAVFEATSAITGTGFGTVAHTEWNAFGWILMVVLMTIGCGSGSTAGGLKLIRVYIIIKAIRWEFRRAFMPEHAVNEPEIWQGEERVFLNDGLIRRVALYVFFYIAMLFIGTTIMTAHGYGVGESLFESASTLGTVGLSVGVTAPDAPASLLWSQSAGMFLGRLEFFAVIIGVAKLITDMRVISQKVEQK
jgi:trk system potassium uptake protein